MRATVAARVRGVPFAIVSSLLITCDAPPLPPENGHNLKTIQVMRALRGEHRIHCVMYGDGPEWAARFREVWGGTGDGMSVTVLRSRGAAGLRAWGAGLTRSTMRRDFAAEAREVAARVRSGETLRVLADFISGAPLAEHVPDGLVISGHDCMSLLMREEARLARGWKARWMRRITARRAERAERRYLHRCAAVHVVSQRDAEALRRINAGARLEVIPLAVEVPAAERVTVERTDGPVLWFNAELPHHQAGVTALLRAQPAGFWSTFRFLGRVSFASAVRWIPELSPYERQYEPYASDLGETLSRAAWVLLPDVTGTGQKNRALTAMAHGCCVVGFEESFRDMPGRHAEEYLRLSDASALGPTMTEFGEIPRRQVGVRARAMVERHYSLEACGARWRALLAGVAPVRVPGPAVGVTG